MRSLSIGAVVVCCGAAFGAGWVTGAFTGVPGDSAAPAVPAPPEPSAAAPAAKDERTFPPVPVPPPGREEPRPPPEAYRDEPSFPDEYEPTPVLALDPERPVRTQADVVAAVRAALEQDRAERDQRERRLREGPYGELNEDVNRMAERVAGVTDSQKEQYAALLAWRREQHDALGKRYGAKEITRQERDDGYRQIFDYMSQRMKQVLNDQQYEQYQAYLRSRRGFWGR